MTTALPKPPLGLSPRAKALWKSVVGTFALEDADLELLRNALVALDRADAAAAEVAEHGVVVLDRYGSPKSNPAVDIELRSRALFARILGQLQIKSEQDEKWDATRARARRAAHSRWDNR